MTSTWSAIAEVDELDTDEMKAFELDGRRLLLVRTAERFYVVDEMCSHEDYSLALGCIKGQRIKCSLHGSYFDLDSGEELGANAPGMLMITGPNVMKGYLGREDLTAEVIKDGWYVTGDVAVIDDEGFIKITGRESRFSKIGGEMVPHIKIEEDINELLNAEEQLLAAVTAVPDAKKGERLIVIHTQIEHSVEEIRKGLSERGLPNLFIPSADSFHQVDALPVLGTGKLDLKAVKQLAMERFASEEQDS